MSEPTWNQPPPGSWGPPPATPGPSAGPGGPGSFGPTPGSGQPNDQERMLALVAHLSPLAVGFFGPLILMFIDVGGAPSKFVKHHAKQSLIWTISLLVVAMLTCGVGGLVMMVWQVIAALAAQRGEWYAYPLLSGFVDRDA